MLTCVEFVEDKRTKVKLPQGQFMRLHAHAAKVYGLRLRGLNTWSLCINPASTVSRSEVYKIVAPLGRTLVDLGHCDDQLAAVVDQIEAEGANLEPRFPLLVEWCGRLASLVRSSARDRSQMAAILLALGVGAALGRRSCLG
jgi:hypothetical protein